MFCSNCVVFIPLELHGLPRLCLPCAGTVLRYIIIQVWARAVRDSSCFFLEKKTQSGWSKYIPGTWSLMCNFGLVYVGSSPGKSASLYHLFSFTFAFFSFFFPFFSFPLLCCIFDQSAPWTHFARKLNEQELCAIICIKSGLYSDPDDRLLS